MKIAVWHNLPSGGGKRALYGHVAGLVARGHYVEAWCPSSADERYLPLSQLVTEHRLPFALPRPSSHRLIHGLKERLGLNQRALLAEMNRHSQECAQFILRGGFDLVFVAPCRFYFTPRLGHFLQGHGLPLCLYLQEPCRIRYEARPELPWLARSPAATDKFFPLKWCRDLADFVRIRHLRVAARREVEDAKSYDLILVNSYFSRESIARIYALDARVCYLGYDAERFHRLEPAPVRQRFIIGLGSMDSIKGVDSAIRAVGRLPAPRPTLVWVANSGDAHYRLEMERLAAQEEVAMEIKSRIDDDVLVDLLNRAALLLYTSHLEPFGYAPLEANACGAPVVAVAEGGVRETVSNGVNGLLCDRDPEALARAMQRILDDPVLADELSKAGVQVARDLWSPEAGITRLEEHLRTLLKVGRLST